MRCRRLKHTALVSLVLVLLSVINAVAAIEFVYPAPFSWVAKPGHMIVKFNQVNITAARITLNGLASEMIDVGSPEYLKLFQDYFIAQSLWDNGRNNLTIDLFRSGQRIESASTTIYYTGGDSTSRVPPEFSSNTLHTPDKERMCLPCHNMNPTPAQMNSNVEKNNPCFGCHKKMLSVKYVHGPAGTYSCGYCHSNKGTPKHAVPKRGAALCYECHADMALQLKKRSFVHGPVEAGMCEACHDSHGSGSESQLIKPVNELCISCHGHIRTTAHVVRIPTGEGHPLSGKPDPAKKGTGREMSCISCHNPHGGDVRYFFVNAAEDRMALCQMCHNK